MQDTVSELQAAECSKGIAGCRMQDTVYCRMQGAVSAINCIDNIAGYSECIAVCRMQEAVKWVAGCREMLA